MVALSNTLPSYGSACVPVPLSPSLRRAIQNSALVRLGGVASNSSSSSASIRLIRRVLSRQPQKESPRQNMLARAVTWLLVERSQFFWPQSHFYQKRAAPSRVHFASSGKKLEVHFPDK